MKTYFRLIYLGVFFIMLIQCGSSKQNNNMISGKTKIIMQTNAGVILQIEGDSFSTTQNFDLTALNNIVKQYKIKIKPIESKVTQISDYQLFQLFVEENSQEVIKKLLTIKDIVDGAYEKPLSEDPNILEE